VREAVRQGTFDDRTDRHLSYAPLMLDEQGWRDLNERMAELLEWAIEEQANSAGRLQDGAGGGAEVRARLTMMSYSAPVPEAKEPAAKGRRAKR
jgi:hypothetical protein